MVAQRYHQPFPNVLQKCSHNFVCGVEDEQGASRMVSKVLTAKQKRNNVLTANIFLNDLDTDLTLLNRSSRAMTAGVQYNSSTKQQMMWWKKAHKMRHKKASMSWSQPKLMLILFSALAERVPCHQNVNVTYYVYILQKLQNGIQNKRRELQVNNSLVLNHDTVSSTLRNKKIIILKKKPRLL